MNSPELAVLPIEVLYVEHHGWLRNWLGKKMGNASDAADIAHDTYVRVLSSDRLFPAHESRRFLTQIANGLVIDLYRRRKIEAAYLDTLANWPEAQIPSEEQRAMLIEQLMQIDTLLHRLPGKTRLALLMCKIDGLPYRDIAGRLAVSVATVERYVVNGLLACYEAAHGQHD
jgi:RNA polymerase sigma-70 factor (ECF subfamily)